MRKILLVTILFAVAWISHPGAAFSGPPQTEPTAEVRGGEGSRADGGEHWHQGGGRHWHEGGGRGGAAGGEFREQGGRGEFREHERHEGFRDGVIIGPGYGYYPYYYPDENYPYPSYQEAPDYEEPDYLLYCDDPQGYFPNVVQCYEDWDRVPRDWR